MKMITSKQEYLEYVIKKHQGKLIQNADKKIDDAFANRRGRDNDLLTNID